MLLDVRQTDGDRALVSEVAPQAEDPQRGHCVKTGGCEGGRRRFGRPIVDHQDRRAQFMRAQHRVETGEKVCESGPVVEDGQCDHERRAGREGFAHAFSGLCVPAR